MQRLSCAAGSLGRMSIPLLLLLLLLLQAPLKSAGALPELNVSVIESNGFCDWDSSSKQWFGFVPDVVKEIGKLCNFTPNLVRVADGRYGRMEESTKEWNGLIGGLKNGHAELAAAPLTQTALREKHVDFTHEILDVGLVLIGQPQLLAHPVTRSAAFFLRIFDVGVWVAAILVFAVTSLLLFVNNRFNPREAKPDAPNESSLLASAIRDSDFSLLGSMFFVVSTGCFQGYRRAPVSLAGRCISLFWWVFACVFAATYVAGFLCGLVASRGSLNAGAPMQNPRDRYAADAGAFDSFVPVWMPGGSTEHTMSTSDEPLFQLFYRLNAEFKSKGGDQLSKLTKATDLIKLLESDSKFIGIMESDSALLYARRSQCKLTVTGQLLNDKSYGFALPEKSNWTQPINHAILLLRENGFIRDAYRKYFGNPSTSCQGSSRPLALSVAGEELARMFRDSLPISIGTFAGPLAMYAIGLVVALLCSVVDGYVYTRYERYRQPGSQPFHNVQEPTDPTFGHLAFSDDQEPVVPKENA